MFLRDKVSTILPSLAPNSLVSVSLRVVEITDASHLEVRNFISFILVCECMCVFLYTGTIYLRGGQRPAFRSLVSPVTSLRQELSYVRCCDMYYVLAAVICITC